MPRDSQRPPGHLPLLGVADCSGQRRRAKRPPLLRRRRLLLLLSCPAEVALRWRTLVPLFALYLLLRLPLLGQRPLLLLPWLSGAVCEAER